MALSKEQQRKIDNAGSAHKGVPLNRRARGDWRAYSRTSVPVAADPSIPLADETDNRIAWWFGKRIYLGNDSQVSRLFWMLARRAGYARPRAEIIWELEHPDDPTPRLDDIDLPKAEIRLRKTLSRLRRQLRESRMDDHVCIVNEKIDSVPPWNDVKGLTMFVRCAQPSARRSA